MSFLKISLLHNYHSLLFGCLLVSSDIQIITQKVGLSSTFLFSKLLAMKKYILWMFAFALIALGVSSVGAAWDGTSLVDPLQVTALSADAQSGFQTLIATLLAFAPYIILIMFGSMGFRLISKKLG